MKTPSVLVALAALWLPVAVVFGQGQTPRTAVDSLLAADVAFAADARQRTPADIITAMLAEAAIAPQPDGTFARGKSAVQRALAANPDNSNGRLDWFPARGGVSADGQHGFTVGYMTQHRPDGTQTPLKYLAYWVRENARWRVAIYRRSRSVEGTVPREPLPPALPRRLIAQVSDPAAIARHRASLIAAEQAFSDEAQAIGIGPAFAKHGSADAMNMGGPKSPTFLVGADAIGRNVGAGGPVNESPVRWAADYDALVASSGDLGATMGFIRPKTPPPAGQPAAIPFVTIWRRGSVSEPWKYVAE
jgi:ketosteroid isomerase-like protein